MSQPRQRKDSRVVRVETDGRWSIGTSVYGADWKHSAAPKRLLAMGTCVFDARAVKLRSARSFENLLRRYYSRTCGAVLVAGKWTEAKEQIRQRFPASSATGSKRLRHC